MSPREGAHPGCMSHLLEHDLNVQVVEFLDATAPNLISGACRPLPMCDFPRVASAAGILIPRPRGQHGWLLRVGWLAWGDCMHEHGALCDMGWEDGSWGEGNGEVDCRPGASIYIPTSRLCKCPRWA